MYNSLMERISPDYSDQENYVDSLLIYISRDLADQ